MIFPQPVSGSGVSISIESRLKQQRLFRDRCVHTNTQARLKEEKNQYVVIEVRLTEGQGSLGASSPWSAMVVEWHWCVVCVWCFCMWCACMRCVCGLRAWCTCGVHMFCVQCTCGVCVWFVCGYVQCVCGLRAAYTWCACGLCVVCEQCACSLCVRSVCRLYVVMCSVRVVCG